MLILLPLLALGPTAWNTALPSKENCGFPQSDEDIQDAVPQSSTNFTSKTCDLLGLNGFQRI